MLWLTTANPLVARVSWTRRCRHPALTLRTLAVRGLGCRLRKLTTTDEGRIALVFELEASDPSTLEQIRDLIRIQQGELLLSLEGLQGELPL